MAVAFSIGDKGYAGTGIIPTAYMDDLWEYDPNKNNWQQKASLPGGGRTGTFAFCINNKGYIGGGARDTLTFYDFWEYDALENKWAQKADLPLGFHFPGSLVSFSLNGKGYLRGSSNNDNFWEYDPINNIWAKRAKFPGTSWSDAVGFSIGDKGYIGTGFDGFNATSEFWEYNPAIDAWIKKTDFAGIPRSGAVAFVIGNKGYVGMGNTGSAGGGITDDFWAYDPSTDSWTQIDSCGYGAEGAFAFSIGSKGYVGTGLFLYEGEFWEYDSNVVSVNPFTENNINDFILEQNYPNPFNPETKIRFTIPEQAILKLAIYDILGREIIILEDNLLAPGYFERNWRGLDASGNQVSSGIYFCRLYSKGISGKEYSRIIKMMLLK